MNDDSTNKQRSKMSALVSGGEEKKTIGEKASPLTRLPQKANATFSSHDTPKKVTPLPQKTAPMDKTPAPPSTPVQAKGKPAPVSPADSDGALKGFRLKLGPAFWTITGIMSLLVNGVLIAVLIILLLNVRPLLLSVQTLQLGDTMEKTIALPGGLYTNFELMDRAHITAMIPVETTIPVKFDLPLNQQTNVVLSENVTITNALVTVQTAGLTITRAPTTIILPQGTTLPVFLNLTVPVDTTVPVVLNVPVDIALANTDLHKPFTGLQEVVRPFYCMLNKNAVNLDGVPICQ
jgi:hypothetical protein